MSADREPGADDDDPAPAFRPEGSSDDEASAQPNSAMSPEAQILEGLGLSPAGGRSKCPGCNVESLEFAPNRVTCTRGCETRLVVDRLMALARTSARGGLEALTLAWVRVLDPSGNRGSGPAQIETTESDAEEKIGSTLSATAAWPSKPTGAFYGPLGEAANAIEPLTEADATAVLAQLLVAFGNAVGRGPRVVLGNVRQWANLFTVIVGKSSKSRKGTSWENASEVVRRADETWASERINSGLSSGEGVIHAVRDAVMVREPIREGGRKTGPITGYQTVEQDPGVEDKRLLVVEPEFARALKVASRKENVLSPVIRAAWDNGNLNVLTRSPYKASGAHVSIIGHITREELSRELSACDSFNGFANRFLWLCARRSKELPFGEQMIENVAADSTARIVLAVQQCRARGDHVVSMDAACRQRWQAVYSRLSADKPGLVGAVVGRAEAQALRLALIYALADAEDTIRLPHLEAALALWSYAEESARVIFGDALGDTVADEILRVLGESPEGMTRDELRNHFSRHVSAGRLTQALEMLAENGLARGHKVPPEGGRAGRPAEHWFATPAQRARSANSAEIPNALGNNGANRANRAAPDGLVVAGGVP